MLIDMCTCIHNVIVNIDSKFIYNIFNQHADYSTVHANLYLNNMLNRLYNCVSHSSSQRYLTLIYMEIKETIKHIIFS